MSFGHRLFHPWSRLYYPETVAALSLIQHAVPINVTLLHLPWENEASAPFPWNWADCVTSEAWWIKHFHRVLGLPALRNPTTLLKGSPGSSMESSVLRFLAEALTDSWRQPPPMSDQESRQRQPLILHTTSLFPCWGPRVTEQTQAVPTESVSIKKKKKKGIL